MADDVADEGSGGPGPGPDAAIGGIDENLDPDGVVVEEETSQNGNEVLVENRLEVLGYWTHMLWTKISGIFEISTIGSHYPS